MSLPDAGSLSVAVAVSLTGAEVDVDGTAVSLEALELDELLTPALSPPLFRSKGSGAGLAVFPPTLGPFAPPVPGPGFLQGFFFLPVPDPLSKVLDPTPELEPVVVLVAALDVVILPVPTTSPAPMPESELEEPSPFARAVLIEPLDDVFDDGDGAGGLPAFTLGDTPPDDESPQKTMPFFLPCAIQSAVQPSCGTHGASPPFAVGNDETTRSNERLM